jgi:hypothetical protein
MKQEKYVCIIPYNNVGKGKLVPYILEQAGKGRGSGVAKIIWSSPP